LNPSQPEAAIDERKDKKAMKRILHVDDSRTARLVNSMILSQRSNYELVSASDGKEALEKVHEARPDLILMNIIMPRMTGLEACRALKKDKDTQEIPVILLTAEEGEQNAQEAYASGCSDYLTEPVNGVQLLDLLKAYLGE
jgi:CheY-like chemotaxis protein